MESNNAREKKTNDETTANTNEDKNNSSKVLLDFITNVDKLYLKTKIV